MSNRAIILELIILSAMNHKRTPPMGLLRLVSAHLILHLGNFCTASIWTIQCRERNANAQPSQDIPWSVFLEARKCISTQSIYLSLQVCLHILGTLSGSLFNIDHTNDDT